MLFRSLTAYTRTASIPDGACFVRLVLVMSQTGSVYPHRKLLTEGYVSTYSSIGYGSASILGPPSDHFYVSSHSFSDPAAGSSITYTIPDFTEFILQSIIFTFAADATVITRRPKITIEYSDSGVHSYFSTFDHLASETFLYTTTNDIPKYENTSIIVRQFPTPQFRMIAGEKLGIIIQNIQVGDQLSDVRFIALRRTIPFKS